MIFVGAEIVHTVYLVSCDFSVVETFLWYLLLTPVVPTFQYSHPASSPVPE